MRRLLKLAACVIMPFIANGIAFAGPCEDGCVYNNTQCTNQANANYSQCMTAANSCETAAESNYQFCMAMAYWQFNNCLFVVNQQEQSICMSMLRQDEESCNAERWGAYNNCYFSGQSSVGCESYFQIDQQYCANDYDNCLFLCSVQNP